MNELKELKIEINKIFWLYEYLVEEEEEEDYIEEIEDYIKKREEKIEEVDNNNISESNEIMINCSNNNN